MNTTPQTASQTRLSGLSLNTFLLAFASFFADVSTEMQYPVLPTFLTQTLGADGTIVGLIDGCAQALQNIVQGFTGTLSDRLQRRKPIALCGYLVAAIAKPLTGLASNWPQAFAARCLDRLGAGSRSAPRDALIASSTDEKNRGRAFGLEGVGDNAGAFLRTARDGVAALRRARSHSLGVLSHPDSGPHGIHLGPVRPGETDLRCSKNETGRQPAAVAARLLDLSSGDG